MVHWWEDDGAAPTQYLLGAFAADFNGLGAPAPCGTLGRLCAATLPQAIGESAAWIDLDLLALDLDYRMVGYTIQSGGFDLDFFVDPATGFAGYRGLITGSGLPFFDLAVEGQWGSWSGADVVPVAKPLLGLSTSAGGFLSIQDALELQWTPSADAASILLEVRSPIAGRVWRLPDSGSLSVPAGELPAYNPGDLLDIVVYRVVAGAPVEVDGKAVTGEAWTSVSYRGGVGGLTYSCKAIRDTIPGSGSGVYAITPDPAAPPEQVYCDMTTDGGGWTLVASSRNSTFDDALAAWSTELTTTTPVGPMAGIWGGMRPVASGPSDIRFSCKKQVDEPQMFVDLSFYANGWYRTITTGSDAASCINESNGAGAGPPPARRNNLTGASLVAGDQWAAGYIESEDGCGDTGDFTVDFDDRGMDSNQADGTDWGEDDSSQKCGDAAVASGGAWFIWVRE